MGQGNAGGGGGHSGGGGQSGNGGGNSGGGQGGGKGKGKGKGKEPDINIAELLLEAVKAGGKLAYGPALAENKDTQGKLKAQGPVIERAYDAYAQQVQQMQATMGAQTQALQQGIADTGAQLGATGAAVTDAGAAEAQTRAAQLGQGSSVADTYRALGGSAGVSRAELAGAQVAQATQVGTANLTDLASRGVTGERDRIRAHQDLRQMKLGNRQDRADILKEKGAYMSEKFFEYMQQQEENQIAREGLALQASGQRLDAKAQRQDNALAEATLAANISDDEFDNALAALTEKHSHQDDVHDNQDTGGQGQGAAGLTPTQQDEYHKTIASIKSVRDKIDFFRGEKGFSPAKARAKALQATGHSGQTWLAAIAAQLAKDGDLSKSAISILEQHLPSGASAPNRWT